MFSIVEASMPVILKTNSIPSISKFYSSGASSFPVPPSYFHNFSINFVLLVHGIGR